MAIYQSKFYQNGSPPDEYQLDQLQSTFLFPASDFVISRDKDGDTLSKYGDNTWDLTPYTFNVVSRSKIHFRLSFSNSNIYNEDNLQCYKWLIFILIYLTPNNSYFQIKAVETIIAYSDLIRHLLTKIDNKDYSLKEFIQSQPLISSVINQLSKKALKTLPSLLNYLLLIGKEKTGISPLERSFISSLSFKSLNLNSEELQTPIIPKKIYSSIIQVVQTQLALVLANDEKIINFVKQILVDKSYARSHSAQLNYHRFLGKKNRKKCNTLFAEAVEQFELRELFNNFNVSSMLNLSSFLKLIQNLVRLQIHIYTGMRKNEVLGLKYDCLKCDTSSGRQLYYLEGFSTKLTKSRINCRWIVSLEAIEGIKFCQKLTAAIVNASLQKQPKNFYLFTNVASISKVDYEPNPNSVSDFFADFEKQKLLKVFKSEIQIRESDLEELRSSCPERNWEDDEIFHVGNLWPFTNHQFRRSLAFYVSQSGLVSLPSLKQQLKHITNQMTLYYARGSGIQLSFFMQDNKDHFISELKRTKPSADTLAFIKLIIESNESLNGAGGRYIEKYNKSNLRSNSRFIDRNEIIKKFKNGEISYSETPLGACLSSTPCDKRALRAISACIDCEKAIIKPSKLEQIIISMEEFVQKLAPSSVEHKFENEQLQDLKRMQRNIRERNE